MKDLRTDVEWARTHVASALNSLRSAAIKIDDIANAYPATADHVSDVRSQLWAMEGLTREIEAKIAGIYTLARK